MLNSYYKLPAFVILLIEMYSEEVEEYAEIPYPLPNPAQLDFWEIVNDCELEKRATECQITKFEIVIY